MARSTFPGGNKDLVRKKTHRDIPSPSHMPNKPPHQPQTTTEDEANVLETI